MKVLANRYLYQFRDHLPDSVELHLFDPGNRPDNIHKYDALFVNTTTRVNRETLPERGNLRFIATGSSGTDHLDLDYLRSLGIKTVDAAGCNAKTVAEYVLTSILLFSESSGLPVRDQSVGIVGMGHVGSEVARLLERFDVPHIRYDPPKSERMENFSSAPFSEIKKCSIVTFHTPLVESGNHPTRHLLNRSWFRDKGYNLVINSARGGVIDESLVLEEMDKGRLKHAVIDVWENEPRFSSKVANRAMLATPHIAGYSVQSKRRATQMIIGEFCRHFEKEIPLQDRAEKHYPEMKDHYRSLREILLDLNPIGWYDQKLRGIASLPEDMKAAEFSKLRSESSLRHEYTSLFVDRRYLEKFPELQLLGVNEI